MKTLIRAATFIAALGLTGFSYAQHSTVPSQTAVGQPQSEKLQSAALERVPGRLDSKELEAWLDGFMANSLDEAKIAGAVVSVVKDGALHFSKGYGFADVEAEQAMHPARTLVRTGSTSKLFTWTAVMQLVEQGKLDLDQDINAYLDFEIPDRSGPPVTMNHLMTHRGGFEEGLKEVLITDPEKNISTEYYLKNHPRPRIFATGTVPAYSNYGTALAGYIVERLSGEPFDDYVDRHILKPLEMAHSTFAQPLPAELESNMSKGYFGSDEPPWKFEFVATAPAGSLSSTANDMANFMIAHLQEGKYGNEMILRQETARLMHSPSIDLPAGFATMAHGFFSAEVNGRWVMGHGGDTVVFHTDMNLLPQEGVGIFVSFNSRGANESVYGVRQRLFQQFMDRYFPDPDPGTASDRNTGENAELRAAAIAGSYQSSRRVETAFLKLFYILQQSKVTANADGSVSLSSAPGSKFYETEPGLWSDGDSDHKLFVSNVDGRMTIVDSRNPTAVRHATPASQNAAVNLILLSFSLVVMFVSLISAAVAWRYRCMYTSLPRLAARPLLGYRLCRLAALANFAYLYAWYLALAPLLKSHFDAYGPAMDGRLRMLQFAAVIPLAGAVIGLWNLWLTIRARRHWAVIVGNVLLAVALLGIVWVAWIGKLMGFNLEY